MAKLDVSKIDVRGLGDYIREQRGVAQISLRQLATLAGVSNPYLSQIERGLRKPSAEILQQIAKALRISAEALYVQAGILEERYVDSDVPTAIFTDSTIDDRQKQVLLEMYQSFRIANAGPGGEPDSEPGIATLDQPEQAAVARRASKRRAAEAAAEMSANGKATTDGESSANGKPSGGRTRSGASRSRRTGSATSPKQPRSA